MLLSLGILATILSYAAAQCEQYDTGICQGKTGPIFIPSDRSCEGWIQCRAEAIFNCGSCGPLLYFDPVLRACTHRENVDCDISTRNLCTDGVINRVAHPSSCSIYFQCTGAGDPIERSCGPLLHFNTATEKCDFIHNVRCMREPYQIECPATTAPFTQEPHPFACDRFFICINGVGTERTCVDGMHFDVNLRECQVIALAQCILNEDTETAELTPEIPDPEPEIPEITDPEPEIPETPDIDLEGGLFKRIFMRGSRFLQ